MTKSLSLSDVQNAVAGTPAAFRCITEYQPAGGPNDKVFPPTYEGGNYAHEIRRIDGKEVRCVLLDSVQSQANRMESSLLDAWERGQIALPVMTVDFAGHDLQKVLRITSLEAPHRIADALFRDSLLDGSLFRKSAIGKRLDHVDHRNATPLFELCPTTLVFGMWDSTGPKRGLGTKFARSIVSEIIGLNAQVGVKTSSRIDPAEVMLQAGPLYKSKDAPWTLDEKAAEKDKKGAIKLGKEGKPSEANHGNIMPTISDRGGVTISTAVQTTVLSLPGLRRLRFPLAGQSTPGTDDAARTTLAALALCAAALMREHGADLRSRCHLVPTTPFKWELLDKPGEAPKRFALTGDDAVALLNEAVGAAKAAGLPWMEKELVLKPSPQLVQLVKRSQDLAAKVAVGGEVD
jgi:CRISPR-associated protein Csb1